MLFLEYMMIVLPAYASIILFAYFIDYIVNNKIFHSIISYSLLILSIQYTTLGCYSYAMNLLLPWLYFPLIVYGLTIWTYTFISFTKEKKSRIRSIYQLIEEF